MQPAAALLVIISAFLHALWNAALKQQKDPETAAVAILFISTILAAAAVPFASGPAFSDTTGFLWSLGAGLCEGGYFVTLALAMSLSPMGIVYTISRGGSIVAVWPLSVLLLGEPLTMPALAGAIVVLCGLILVGVDSGNRKASSRGLILAVLCALCISGYHLCYKCALSTGARPTAVFAAALGLALPINIGRFGRAGLSRVAAVLKQNPLGLGISGAICTASFLIFLIALERSGAGAVLTLRNTSVIFAVILAWRMGEEPGARQIAGTMAVAAGAVMLGWPV